MNRILPRTCLIVVLTSLLTLGGVASAAEGHEAGNRTLEYASDHVLIQVEDSAAARGLGVARDSLGHGWYRVAVPTDVDAREWAAELAGQPGVESAEVDLVFRALATPPFTPNDPLYVGGAGNANAQWHLHVIDLLAAWQTTVGNGARVAVLDSGISPGPDGFCGGGFVAEYNAVTDVGGPGSAPDDNGHGTHVAGSIGQCSGNALGGAGVATDGRIMPVDVFSGDVAFASHIVRGIDHAIANGADAINLSLGIQGGSSDIINAAIERALAADIVVVAAAGNDPGPVFFPASHPGVIGVGATTISNGVASYSSGGVGLDVVAPGGSSSAPIWQEIEEGYAGSTGTSMAAAHVSGVVALLRARYPLASGAQVRNALTCTTNDLGAAGWDSASGFGLVQAGAAVSELGAMVGTGALSCSSQVAGGSKVAAVGMSTGFWRLFHGPSQIGSYFYGNPGDLPFMGDWDCDGVDTPGLYRQSDGFVYLRNSNTQGVADIKFFFGNPGDVPLAGDFDGDGCDTVSIYRPSEARFYIIDELGSNGGGLGAAAYSFLFGNLGDVAFVGDWNGDGIDTPGLRRPSDGFVYLRNTNTQGVANLSFFYGNPGDVVFSGDWDADGRDSIGLYRPSNGVVYLRDALSTGVANLAFPVGSGMLPAAGDL
ncbi:MAG: S8 family serine peptidase [Acidimicrobiia bacterium]